MVNLSVKCKSGLHIMLDLLQENLKNVMCTLCHNLEQSSYELWQSGVYLMFSQEVSEKMQYSHEKIIIRTIFSLFIPLLDVYFCH